MNTVPKGGGSEPAIRRGLRHVTDDCDHLARNRAGEEMIACNLIGPAQLLRQLQHPPHLAFIQPQIRGKVADARRAKAGFAGQVGFDTGPQRLILG